MKWGKNTDASTEACLLLTLSEQQAGVIRAITVTLMMYLLRQNSNLCNLYGSGQVMCLYVDWSSRCLYDFTTMSIRLIRPSISVRWNGLYEKSCCFKSLHCRCILIVEGVKHNRVHSYRKWHPSVDYFSVTACPNLFHASYTTAVKITSHFFY